MKALHWLPVEQRIVYQLCLLMDLIHVGQAPQYLTDCVSSTGSRGRQIMRTTFCRQQEPSLESVVSVSVVQLSELHDIWETKAVIDLRNLTETGFRFLGFMQSICRI